MRTKSQARRQAILDAAVEVFQREGFERASMAAICQRIGYSKATLYNYFPSKEELFFEVLFATIEAEFQATHAALSLSAENISQALELFGRRLLPLLYSPQALAMRRLLSAEAGRGDLGRRCYEHGPERSQSEIARFLKSAMDSGKLRQTNARIAALHLVGLLDAEWSAALLCQTRDSVTPEEVAETVSRAVAVFIAAYGNQQPQPIDSSRDIHRSCHNPERAPRGGRTT